MWQSDIERNISDLVKGALESHLGIESEWFGDPKDSTFGISFRLTWDGVPFRYTVVNFLDEYSLK